MRGKIVTEAEQKVRMTAARMAVLIHCDIVEGKNK